jgi:hypothetical protein
MNPSSCDREHDFTLVLTGVTDITPAVEDALFSAGCDDATIAARSGRLFVTFSRAAGSIKDAIFSAIRDLGNANIGADVLRVDSCNLVTQSEIARKIGRSRQLVHQFTTGARGPGRFPPPACDVNEESPLWDWCEVAGWLWENSMIREAVLRDAEAVEAINLVLELEQQRRIRPELMKEVIRSVAPGLPCG